MAPDNIPSIAWDEVALGPLCEILRQTIAGETADRMLGDEWSARR